MGAPKGNQYAKGHEGYGEPKHNDPKELEKLIDSYFLEASGKPTISGLAYHLGFVSRQSVYDYSDRNKSKELAYIIKKAVVLIESIHEEGLYSPACTGHIFWLKQRGWKDTQEVTQDTNITIKDGTDLGLP